MEAAVIQPLPEAVAAQIAAGQVIDSLAAVVRELVENALDAQATRVTIDLWPESGRIQVADNGQGLSLDNLQRAAAPHSTSKIHTQADLWQVASLGFRGQALHSLAQAGQLTLCSRPPGAETGWQVTYSEAGVPQQSTPTAMASGTIATVTNLFQDWPARRLGLPSSARQLRAVQHILYDLALCHPQVTWLVRLGDRPWFSLTPGPTARALWPQMISTLGAADLREIHQAIPWVTSGSTSSSAHTHQAKAASLYGLIGLPDRCHRARPDQVKVAVNGRRVALPELEQAALRAFRHTLPRHRYPLCFLHLRVPPYALDWHRRADKSTLYLRQLDRWLAQVEDCIDTLLRQPTLGEADSANHQRVTTLLKAAEIRGSYQPPPQRQVNLSDPLPASPWPGMLTALAQVHNRYIVAEQPDGLCLVEQHIAHERVLYERLLDQWQVVPLAVPVVLDQLSEAQVDQLQRLGLGVELFGPRRWAIRRVPAPLCDRSDLSEALLELSLGRDLDNALVAIACRTAIRNGTPLTLPEMQTLLNDWQRTRNPRTCPHGRPIALTLTESSLARFFRRHWVIGKSHGLE
ncbi:MAG TPA: DNA mismatch repair endonuclease MutL [Leptolyngbyaceae cyanobacterium M65_K2018_010]|nr:DNA mismatch repair endonuclease MutL [Leptolyngbyaceae cyanobacterium M65_K2018_010]